MGLLSKLSGAGGHKKARRAIQAGMTEAIGYQKPFMEFGKEGMGQVSKLLADPGALREDPSYDFLQGEAQRLLRGTSGAAGKSISGQFGRQAAERIQSTFFQARERILSPYFQQIGIGQRAGEQMGQFRMRGAEGIAGIRVQEAQAKAGMFKSMMGAAAMGMPTPETAAANKKNGGGQFSFADILRSGTST